MAIEYFGIRTSYWKFYRIIRYYEIIVLLLKSKTVCDSPNTVWMSSKPLHAVENNFKIKARQGTDVHILFGKVWFILKLAFSARYCHAYSINNFFKNWDIQITWVHISARVCLQQHLQRSHFKLNSIAATRVSVCLIWHPHHYIDQWEGNTSRQSIQFKDVYQMYFWFILQSLSTAVILRVVCKIPQVVNKRSNNN